MSLAYMKRRGTNNMKFGDVCVANNLLCNTFFTLHILVGHIADHRWSKKIFLNTNLPGKEEEKGTKLR